MEKLLIVTEPGCYQQIKLSKCNCLLGDIAGTCVGEGRDAFMFLWCSQAAKKIREDIPKEDVLS